MDTSEKLLLIEDEVAICDSVAYSLRKEGFEVVTAHDGITGLSLFRSASPTMIILDLMLPKLNGMDLCRIIRKESSVPIIMLTAKTEEVDRILGLELGADDYVTKPFGIRELIARVRAIYRRLETSRRDQERQSIVSCGSIEMDVTKRRVTVRGEVVHLPVKQFELLKTLLSNKEKVVSREELFKRVWDEEASYDTGTLDVHIRWLREKIEEDPSRPRHILTMRGVGYRLVCLEDALPS